MWPFEKKPESFIGRYSYMRDVVLPRTLYNPEPYDIFSELLKDEVGLDKLVYSGLFRRGLLTSAMAASMPFPDSAVVFGGFALGIKALLNDDGPKSEVLFNGAHSRMMGLIAQGKVPKNMETHWPHEFKRLNPKCYLTYASQIFENVGGIDFPK